MMNYGVSRSSKICYKYTDRKLFKLQVGRTRVILHAQIHYLQKLQYDARCMNMAHNNFCSCMCFTSYEFQNRLLILKFI